jgi:hypothetical protein
MENASKALIIAGAILLSILIIAIGMYIYTSSHNSISEAGSQISEQEKTSFNQQWNTYEGAQGGNNVKALLQKLIANCNTNREEQQRLVGINCVPNSKGTDYTLTIDVSAKDTTGAAFADTAAAYTGVSPSDAVKVLTGIRNLIEARHTYNVTISYSPDTSLVNLIDIDY